MYNKEYQGDVCSHSHSFFLDNFIRRLIQNPKKIVGEYVREGNVVVDLGCGPGFFSIDMAKMVGPAGRVYSVDLQPEMLDKVRKKAVRLGLEDRMVFHNCPQEKIGLDPAVEADFVLAYYMVHETPDHLEFLREIKNLVKNDEGRILIVEPRFHVNQKQFDRMRRDAESLGYQILATPSKKGGRSLLAKIG